MWQPQDKEQYQKQLREDEARSRISKMLKLPCCGAMIELRRPGDQFVLCPNDKCMKRSLITWSLNPTIKTEGVHDGADSRTGTR